MQHEISIEMLMDLLDRLLRNTAMDEDLLANVESVRALVGRGYLESGEVSFGTEQEESK